MARKIKQKLSKYRKFVNLVEPYIIPSLQYKIRDNFTKKEFLAQQTADSEARDTLSE